MFDAQSKAFNSCDILVHSAGATKGGVFPDQDDTDFIDGFALKFHAGVRLSRLFWPSLVAARGNVVMIVGGASRTPDSNLWLVVQSMRRLQISARH